MNTPRLRIIAGPNGSGKTTLTRYLEKEYALSFALYINADDIERRLRTDGSMSLSQFNLIITEQEIKDFFTQHPSIRAVFKRILALRSIS